MRQGHWAVVDLIGKGGHIRTVPIPAWVKTALDQWIRAARVTEGRIFRGVAKAGKVWGSGVGQERCPSRCDEFIAPVFETKAHLIQIDQ